MGVCDLGCNAVKVRLGTYICDVIRDDDSWPREFPSGLRQFGGIDIDQREMALAIRQLRCQRAAETFRRTGDYSDPALILADHGHGIADFQS